MVNNKINDKYYSRNNQFLREIGKKELEKLFNDIRTKPNYIVIDESQSTIDWDDTKKSKLIESLIMNLPVPPIILAETSYHRYKVIDGRQRLQTVVDFFNNKFALSELDVLTDLNGCTYATLPHKVKDILNHRSLGSLHMIPYWDANPEEIEKFIGIAAERLGNCNKLSN